MANDRIPTAYRETIYYKISCFRMPFTYLMALLAIIFAPQKLFLPALGLIVIGIAVRIWAAGHVVKRHKLSKGGPYAYTRNPLYVGSLFWGVGTFLLIGHWWLLLAFLGGFALLYGCAIRSEEDYLYEHHGEEFALYKKSVPVFVPWLKPAASVRESAFSWGGILRNDEHKALAWSVAVIAAIFLRAYLR